MRSREGDRENSGEILMRKLFVQIGQNSRREYIDPSQQVIRRDHLVEVKLIKELPLISVLPPHHRRLSCRL